MGTRNPVPRGGVRLSGPAGVGPRQNNEAKADVATSQAHLANGPAFNTASTSSRSKGDPASDGIWIGAGGRLIAGSPLRFNGKCKPSELITRNPTSNGGGGISSQGQGLQVTSPITATSVTSSQFGGNEKTRDVGTGAYFEDEDRDDRDREDGKLGKKRKVPSTVPHRGRDEVSDGNEDDPYEHGSDGSRASRENLGVGQRSDDEVDGKIQHRRNQQRPVESDTPPIPGAFPRKNGRWTLSDAKRSPAAKACSWRKGLFLRRKAALITLFLDAQTAINQALNKPPHGNANGGGGRDGNGQGGGKPKVILPEVAVFEQMMPALEDIGVGQWPLDQPGWRTGVEVTDETRLQLEKWRKKYNRRSSVKNGRKKVVRGGWVPEGSFEFEMSSQCE